MAFLRHIKSVSSRKYYTYIIYIYNTTYNEAEGWKQYLISHASDVSILFSPFVPYLHTQTEIDRNWHDLAVISKFVTL